MRLILNLVCERLSRSILTAFRFSLEFRKYHFLHCFDFLRHLSICCLEIKYILDLVWKVFLEVVKFVWADLYLGFSMGAAISLAFDYFSILTRVSEILFFLFDFISTFCPLCLGGRKTRG